MGVTGLVLVPVSLGYFFVHLWTRRVARHAMCGLWTPANHNARFSKSLLPLSKYTWQRWAIFLVL